MHYELEILAALSALPKPTTQDIVTKTGISERKVQNVIKTLSNDLLVDIKTIREGRTIRYTVVGWGVFESGSQLKKALKQRARRKTTKQNPKMTKSAFYDSVKMENFKESSRLEGVEVSDLVSPAKTISAVQSKRTSLLKKYSNYGNQN
ncbi:uncharacterized protein DUF2559 [Alteromonadaceae bacterium 2753L.S.0a.02]|nr:uncharacterized protein DUF2559 [Alteromonadaceae bacterium 2753L.S.0a.02]